MSTETKTIQPADVAAKIVATTPEPETTTPTPQPAVTQEAPANPTETPKTDKRGVPFDPNRHLPKTHPVTKCWMPKKLGKAGKAATAPQAPEPESAAWSEAEKAKAAPQTTPETVTDEAASEAPANLPEAITPAATRRATARGGMRLVYMGTGVLSGNPEDAVPPPKEDKELQDTAAYILEASGWNPGPFIGFGVLLLTYLIFVGSRPKNRQALADWWRQFTAKDVTPIVAPEKTVTPAVTSPTPSAAPVSAFGSY